MVDPRKGFKNKQTLIVDPEFESQIPPLTEEEFQQLEENILSDGVVLHPIVVWNDVIIDGHNRWRIIQKYPFLKYTIYEINFPDRYVALAWICKNQLGRRNLTPYQKKYLIGKQFESEKASQGGDHGNQYTSMAKCQNGTLPTQLDTAERIAKENGIGRRSVFRAEAFSKAVDIADEVEPGTRSRILAGDIKATEKNVQDILHAPPEELPAIVDALGKPKQSKTPPLSDEPIKAWSSMLVEMTDALDSLIFRWEFCQTNYSLFFNDPDCQKEIRNLIRKGFDFINDYKGGLPLQ